jgi:hypothetical protein
MDPLKGQKKFEKALLERLSLEVDGRNFLELLIDNARLYESVLKVTAFEKITFSIDRNLVKPLKHPEFHRLVMVFPESFEFQWLLSVSGYFLVRYKRFGSDLPHRMEALPVIYSGVLIPGKDELVFKSECVRPA